MKNRIGLKLWSTNVNNYLRPACELFESGIYDYIELYVVPGSLQFLSLWKKTQIPYIIHNAHFASGFNLAKKELRAKNKLIYAETLQYADNLKAEKIIFHGGIDGRIEETAEQLRAFNEARALIENKPYIALPNKMGGKYCRGATLEEIKFVMDYVGCGFCLDIGHAICSANTQKRNYKSVIAEFNSLNPYMYHLSDVLDLTSPYDAHPNFGTGLLDISDLKKNLFNPRSPISIETNKNFCDNLDDFVSDVRYFENA